MKLPEYKDLPIDPKYPPHSAWGLWGDDDQMGAINLIDDACVRRGLECARTGRTFSLNWELELPDPPLYGRTALRHNIDHILDFVMDDSYDNFYPQQSSQWDALCHVAHPEYGYYNGRTARDFTGKAGTKNGIEHWARRGIATRGVLLDVARYLEGTGSAVDGSTTVELSVQDLEETRRAAGITYADGDVLLIRTGWMKWYIEADQATRDALTDDWVTNFKSPGLAGGEEMAEYLWDSHIAAVVADNSALEAWPHLFEPGHYLHFDVLALLGIPIGEMWYLEKLAEDCDADKVYEVLLTAAPLNKLGGVGSPANALAIK